MNQDKHKKASESINSGIKTLLSVSTDNCPSPLDLIEVLDILQDKIEQTRTFINVPFYQPQKGPKRTTHDFKRDVMGEMKELLSSGILNPGTDYSMTVKRLVSPIMNRLNLFEHPAALAAAPLVISNVKKSILENC